METNVVGMASRPIRSRSFVPLPRTFPRMRDPRAYWRHPPPKSPSFFALPCFLKKRLRSNRTYEADDEAYYPGSSPFPPTWSDFSSPFFFILFLRTWGSSSGFFLVTDDPAESKVIYELTSSQPLSLFSIPISLPGRNCCIR